MTRSSVPAPDSSVLSLSDPSVLSLSLIGSGLRILLSLTSALNALVLARGLGPAGRGDVFLFVAGVATAARVADLGMSPSAVVFASRAARSWASVHDIISRALLGAACAIAVGAAALLIVVGREQTLAFAHSWWLLGLVVLPFALYEQVWIHTMVGLKRVPTMNTVQLLGGLAMLASNTVLIVFGGGGADGATGVFVVVTMLKATSMLVLARRDPALGLQRGQAALHDEVARPREIFLFGLRGYPNALAALLWTRLPVFILGALQGADAVGIFAVSQQLLEQLLLPVQAVQDAIYPRISRSPRAIATALLNRYVRVTLCALLPVLVLVGVTAPWSVPFAFGATYGRATAVFQILLGGAWLTAISALLSPYFLGQLLRPGTLSALAWVRLLIAAAVSALLARRLAEMGVALALVWADAVTTSLTVALYVRAVRTPLTHLLLVEADDVARIVSRCAAQAHNARAALRLRPLRTRA